MQSMSWMQSSASIWGFHVASHWASQSDWSSAATSGVSAASTSRVQIWGAIKTELWRQRGEHKQGADLGSSENRTMTSARRAQAGCTSVDEWYQNSDVILWYDSPCRRVYQDAWEQSDDVMRTTLWWKIVEQITCGSNTMCYCLHALWDQNCVYAKTLQNNEIEVSYHRCQQVLHRFLFVRYHQRLNIMK